MSSTVEASVFMRKNYSDNLHSIKNTWENLTIKKMFEISEQLILEQSDEIFGVSQISWECSPWKQLSLVNDEEVISLSHAKVCVFMSWKDESEPLIKYFLGATVGMVQKIHHNTELWTQSTETQWNSSGIFSQDSLHWRLVREVQKFMSKMGEPEQFQGRNIFMSMFNDIIWRYKDNETECIANSTRMSLFAKRFPAGQWSFLGPGSEIKWYSTNKERPGGKWDRVA